MSEASPVEDVIEQLIRANLPKGWKLRFRGGEWELRNPDNGLVASGKTAIAALCKALDKTIGWMDP